MLRQGVPLLEGGQSLFAPLLFPAIFDPCLDAGQRLCAEAGRALS